MNRKIKLIWDFRGPDAHKTAEHHEKHLKEYILTEGLNSEITGNEAMSHFHSIAYMVVEEEQMILVRDALIPHRGEIYEE